VVDAVVLAAGAETARLAQPLGLQLPVTPRRIGLAVTEPPGRVSYGPVVIDDVTGTYFVPRSNGTVAVGVRARPECPQVLPAEPLTAAEVAEAIQRGSRRVPAFATAAVHGTQAACDGYTPDNRPILGPVDELPGLHLACGFSGGGYKIAPAVGAHLATGISSDEPADRLAPYNVRRFARGALLVPERPYGHL
jgi:glycine/D-amino acid oxidase-like deaminating enzyme